MDMTRISVLSSPLHHLVNDQPQCTGSASWLCPFRVLTLVGGRWESPLFDRPHLHVGPLPDQLASEPTDRFWHLSRLGELTDPLRRDAESGAHFGHPYELRLISGATGSSGWHRGHSSRSFGKYQIKVWNIQILLVGRMGHSR